MGAERGVRAEAPSHKPPRPSRIFSAQKHATALLSRVTLSARSIAIYNPGLLLNVELGRHAEEAEALFLFRRTLELAPSDPTNSHCGR